MTIEIKNLHAGIEGKEILKGINLKIELGKVHVLMGPNGAGKSCLANVLMGNPGYKVLNGDVSIDNTDITNLNASERARKGLFLSFQYPREISGVTISNFLRTAYNSLKNAKMNVLDFHKMLKEKMQELKIDQSFAKRYLNEGFSGGEKKKMEILQMAILEPKYAILDECDSGLDVSALKIVGEGISKMKTKERAIFIITHYNQLLKYVKPDIVSVMIDGKIVETGGKELASHIEENGFKDYGIEEEKIIENVN